MNTGPLPVFAILDRVRSLITTVFCLLYLGLFAQEEDAYRYTYVENKGQWPEQVLYRAQVEGGFVWVERTGLRVDLRDYREASALHANPEGDLYAAQVYGHCYFIDFGAEVRTAVASDPEVTVHNYFQGNNPAHWAGGCQGYAEVLLKDIYPGIHLRLYSNAFFLKNDWIVDAGRDPSTIQLTYRGTEGLTLNNGRLHVATSLGTQTEQKPIAHLQTGYFAPNSQGLKHALDVRVSSSYTLEGATVSYTGNIPGPHDRLLIDPELIFSTYSGSTADNFGYTATYDDDGNLYSGSSIFGDGYPTTLGAYQTSWAGGDGQGTLAGTDIALTKYSSDGTTRIYSTYLGGAADELPHTLICSPEGELVLMGTTSSDDFPITTGAYQEGFLGGGAFAPSGVGVDYLYGSDMIITRLAADGGSLVGSTYLGGTDNDGVNTAPDLKFNYADEMRGEVILDDAGNVVVVSCTDDTDFPYTNLFDFTPGGQCGTFTVLNADLTDLVWGTLISQVSDEAAYAVDIASDGSFYVCGGTNSSSLPMMAGWQTAASGGQADGYVYRFAADGSAVLGGTYFGSPSYDQLYFVELDANDVVHVFGQTRALGDYWIQNAAYGTPESGMLVAKFTNDLNGLDWSTVVGTGSGRPNLSPTAFLVDNCGLVYLSGWGGSTNVASNPTGTDTVDDMPTTPDAYQSSTDGSDFYLMVITPDAGDLVYATFFGGGISAEHVDGGTSRFNPDGVVYQSVCAGCGGNSDFPIFPSDAVSPTNNSPNCNNGVFKFQFDLPPVLALGEAPEIGCVDAELQFTNLSTNATSYFWDFGDDSTSSLENPNHSYDSPGPYTITLTANNDNCGFTDTYSFTVEISDLVVGSTSATANPVYLDEGESSQLLAQPTGYSYEWSPPGTLDDPFVHDPVATPGESTTYYVLISDGECSVLDSVRVFINELICGRPFVFLPNAFTPDGDGDNDVLFVRGENIERLYLTIYNCWGEMVFETRDKNVGWDGTFSGEPVDPAVFVYYLEVFCIDGQEYFEEGNVTVIR